MEPILEIKHISKTFADPGQPALDAVQDISFCLFPGEILGIAGRSGSGKSTAARILAGLAAPTQGQILLHGQDITRAKDRKRAQAFQQIQMVFQSPSGSFDPMHTLGYSIEEGMKNRKFPKSQIQKQVELLLGQCGLSPEFARRYPHEVSGGQCQRAAIARALALEPEILICDEATSALDVTVQKQIIDLLTSFNQRRGLACIFICHNLALVQSFCSRVLVMHQGRIIEEGTPDQVIFSPVSPLARELTETLF